MNNILIRHLLILSFCTAVGLTLTKTLFAKVLVITYDEGFLGSATPTKLALRVKIRNPKFDQSSRRGL